eukprot:11407-Heterococcus_DN1.PRE.4
MSRRVYKQTLGAGATGRMPTAAQRVQLSAQHNRQQHQQQQRLQQQQARSDRGNGSGSGTASRDPSNGAHNIQRAPAFAPPTQPPNARHTNHSMQPPVQQLTGSIKRSNC